MAGERLVCTSWTDKARVRTPRRIGQVRVSTTLAAALLLGLAASPVRAQDAWSEVDDAFAPATQPVAGLVVGDLLAYADTPAAVPGAGSGAAEMQDPPAEPVDVTPPSAGDPGFIIWADNSISLLPWGDGFAVDPEEQSTITFEHAHASKIGDMFLFVDFNKFHDTPDGVDDSTWYGEIGPRFSLGKMLGKDLSHTFFRRSLFEFKDVLIAMQYERGEDPDIAEAFLLGVGLDLDVREAGLIGRLGKFNYVQLNFYGRHEMTEGAEGGFSDMQVTMAAAKPFKVGNTDWLLDGFFDWVVGFGDGPASFHLNPQLTMDLGAKWGAPKKFYVGLEFDFWWNKYSIENSPGFDTNQAAVSLLMKLHL